MVRPHLEEANMKFMLTWRLYPDKKVETMTGFSKMSTADDESDHGPKVTLIGRWHNVAAGTGVAICESDNADAVYRWGLNWTPMLDLTVEPVLDDREARAVIADAYGT
jgi:hypothetical protein